MWLGEVSTAAGTRTASRYGGFQSKLTAEDFQLMLSAQNPADGREVDDAAVDDPDVDVTGGPGIDVTATGQASAAVESAPDSNAGTYLATPPDCRPTVPFTVP